MAASLVALHRHLHLSDAETFARSAEFHSPGSRLSNAAPPTGGKVLLLDDSAIRCRSINAARKGITESGRCGRFELMCAALYVTPAAAGQLDTYWQIVQMPRVFEWNWLAPQHLQEWMSDIDGVLCRDPVVFDDDGPEYEVVIAKAVPLYLPRRPIHTLISCRLKRWRFVTEQWLAEHGVAAGELVLHPAPPAEVRRRQGQYGRWKGEHYRNSPCTLFIESSAIQAPLIARTALKPVLCVENMTMYQHKL